MLRKFFLGMFLSTLFLIAGCTDGEKVECITSLDCEGGLICVDGKCIENSSETDEEVDADTNDSTVVLPDNGGEETDDEIIDPSDIDQSQSDDSDKSQSDDSDQSDMDTVDDKDIVDTDVIDVDAHDEYVDSVDTDADEDTNDDDTPLQLCGNAIEEGPEECDLGIALNNGSYDGCNEDCTLADRCGDGSKNGPEFCDSGENNGDYGYCNSDCTGHGEKCGDGIKNGQEECDDGADNGDYGYCNAFCTGLGLRCGDGYKNGPFGVEECDNGENNGATSCDYGEETCKVCDTSCKEHDATGEYCGDGIKNGTEACDEGSLNGQYDHCNENCTGMNSCGDSIVDSGTEVCDNNTIACNAISGAGFINSIEVPCNGTCDGWTVDSCVCGTGYEKNGSGICTDINECTVPSHNCDSNASCNNTDGSFICDCNDYFMGSGTECNFCNTATNCGTECSQCPVQTPYCKDNGNSTSQCIECLTNLDCNEGFECNGSGACVDTDECDKGTDNCHENADCINTTGSFYCTCKSNYSGDGLTCTPDTRTGQNCTGLPPNAVWNTASAISQTWSGTQWLPTTTGTYNTTPSTTECRYNCDSNFTWDGDSCEGATRIATCPAKPGGGTVWNDGGKNGTYTQTWSGSTWAPNLSTYYSSSEGDCAYKCASDYHWNGTSCVWNTRVDQSCTGLPSNASWNTVASITQTWNGTTWLPTLSGAYNETSSTTKCIYKCNADYHWNGLSCISNTRINQSCTDLPANAQWNTVSTITQTWNGTDWLPATTGVYNSTGSTTECRYTCVADYHWDGLSCVSDTKKFTCASKPANTDWNTVSSYTQNWNGSAWVPADSTTSYNASASTTSCRYKCSGSYLWSGSACVECLNDDDCSTSYVCNGSNVCEYVCEAYTRNFSNSSTGRSGTIQSWTVPSSGTYKITAYGAQGGGSDGGLGAKISGDFDLVEGTVIKILVGQRGTEYQHTTNDNRYIGGGGGTYVVKNGAADESGIYVIAGGGGGSSNSSSSKRHGSISTSGSAGNGSDEGAGGTGGNGGGSDARGPGGGGFYTNGADAGDSEGGDAYLNGGVGGNGESNCEGGFGGGGGPDGYGNYHYGGGGGGYSGGGGGGGLGDYCGGGGGSYNSGTNQDNVAGNRSGNGYVTIVRVCE